MKRQFQFAPVLILLSAIAMAAAEPDFTVFDQSINALIAKYHIPGATVAVARNGKLAIARAYGLADREHNVPTQPDSLFRIASISKTFTGAAILKLVEEGRLDLDAKAFLLLDHLKPPPGTTADPRLASITIRQLLQHSAGWEHDPIGDGVDAARALHVEAPVSPEDLTRYAMGRRLDFDPGSRFAYSNFGYEVLGRVIEKVTRMPYEGYVKLAILEPIGVRRARLGKTMLSQRAEGEVVHYDMPGAPMVWTTVRGGPPLVPAPYAVPLVHFDACGAWIASAIDLARFALAVDEESGRDLILRRETLRQARQDRVAAWPNWTPPGGKRFYGLGWIIDVAAGGVETWWHSGGLPGSISLLVHRPDGIVVTALFNSNPFSGSFGDMVGSADAYDAFNTALASIREWPEGDLFNNY